MSAGILTPWDLLGIGVAVAVGAVALVGIALAAARRRRRLRAAGGAGGAGDATVTRRVVVQRGLLAFFGAAIAGVVASAADYVVTAVTDRQGRRFTVGSPDDVRRQLAATGTPYYDPVGGFYVVPYPAADLAAARGSYAGAVLDGIETGFVGLDQTCTHLGCRVQWCHQSQWFECPCHGSRYNAVGEQRRGPAPRGLDRYEVVTVDGRLVVDTRHKYLGPPPGTDTTGQEPAGPHCY